MVMVLVCIQGLLWLELGLYVEKEIGKGKGFWKRKNAEGKGKDLEIAYGGDNSKMLWALLFICLLWVLINGKRARVFIIGVKMKPREKSRWNCEVWRLDLPEIKENNDGITTNKKRFWNCPLISWISTSNKWLNWQNQWHAHFLFAFWHWNLVLISRLFPPLFLFWFFLPFSLYNSFGTSGHLSAATLPTS